MDNKEVLTARPYQIDLFEKSIKNNIIVYLPTGTGKTLIAVLLIKHLSNDLQRPYHEGGKRTIFIVNTVALVLQQSSFLARHTGLQCSGYSGDMKVDFWSDEKWSEEIEENQVMTMTAQIFLDLLNHGRISLEQINLLIFDECHRAVKNHPMKQIMQQFQHCSKENQPRVLAMSASLLNANITGTKIDPTIKELETTYNAKIETVDHINSVAEFSTNPTESIEFFDDVEQTQIIKKIYSLIKESMACIQKVNCPSLMENPESSKVFRPESKSDKIKRNLMDVEEHFEEMGLYGGCLSILFHMIQVEFIKKSVDQYVLMNLLDYLTTRLTIIQSVLELEMGSLENLHINSEFLKRYSSPKLVKLTSVLKNFYLQQKDQKFCCIIFVKRRFTAKILYHILKKLSEHDEEFSFLKPEYIVGQSTDPYKNSRETLIQTKWSKEALVRFRNSSSNCIVATDVIDEGVDIPACTLVVRYYAPMDFRSYIQSKGRARHRTSQYIVLVPRNEYLNRYCEYQKTEEYLRKLLHGQTDERSSPTEDEINTFYNNNIKDFVITREDGKVVVITEYSAISIINRYCASLIKSKFISLTPTWVKKEVLENNKKFFEVHLTLPPISPLRESVVGYKMESLDAAKRSAAMNACIKLYHLKELNKDLLPRNVEDISNETDYLFPFWRKEEKRENGQPGTNTMKRLHPLVQAEAFFGAFPRANTHVYLHVIEMTPNYPEPSENRNAQFHSLLKSRKNFAILSSKNLPVIPSFPIFMKIGSIEVHIRTIPIEEPLTHEKVELLVNFNRLIFDEVLGVVKEFMIFDISNEDHSYIMVPVCEDNRINWEVVENYKKIVEIPPTDPIEVKVLDYELSLVKANYRESHVYIATELCEFKTAESRFPTLEFEDYVTYYEQKHGVIIKSPTQPLLEVKPIPKTMNFIKPRSYKSNVSRRKRLNQAEDFEEHLVPELCNRIDFPAVYYLKATALPSILHRITQILVAGDLRNQIKSETNLEFPMATQRTPPFIITHDVCDEEESASSSDESFTEEEDLQKYFENLQVTAPDFDVLSKQQQPTWKEKEPTDIFRNIQNVRMIDIEHYFQFIHGSNSEDDRKLKFQNSIKCKYIDGDKVQVPQIKMLNNTTNSGPDVTDILKSLTAKSSHDSFNFERVETLGDSFLKFAISQFLFHEFPEFNEGFLTYLKGKLVGNMNLYYCAEQKNIAGRVNVEEFEPSTNLVVPCFSVEKRLVEKLNEKKIPPSFLFELEVTEEEKMTGRLSSQTWEIINEKLIYYSKNENRSINRTGLEPFVNLQLISDKCVSDCVEAIIGTYLSFLGIKGAFTILKWFEILPKSLNIEDFLTCQVPDPKLGTGDLKCLMPWAASIEKRIGYQFKEKGFLLQAFTHPSYTANRITASYQRLEFLGDAILDFLLTAYIYEKCDNLNPGELTDLRSALVNNITFACLAVRHGLNTALQAFAPKIFEHVDRFVRFQEDRDYKVDDELLWILSEENDCYMSEHVDVPKVLGDIFESLIGAIYLDSGKSLNTVWEVIYNIMHKEIDRFSLCVPKQPVRVIFEYPGANPKFSKSSIVPDTQNTIKVTLTITVNDQKKYFHGFGASRKLAKCAASKQALKYLATKKPS